MAFFYQTLMTMDKNRRDFLKKAALGSVAVTSVGGLSVLEANGNAVITDGNEINR